MKWPFERNRLAPPLQVRPKFMAFYEPVFRPVIERFDENVYGVAPLDTEGIGKITPRACVRQPRYLAGESGQSLGNKQVFGTGRDQADLPEIAFWSTKHWSASGER